MEITHTFVKDFLANVHEHPNKVAVMDRSGSDTYAQLNHRSALLASVLLKSPLTKEQEGQGAMRIALLLPRSRSYMTALLAVVRANCVAVPIDAEYPKERIQSIIDSAGCRLCITSEELSSHVAGTNVMILEDTLEENEGTEMDEDLNLSDPDMEGLILFTSGSTGKPKGVVHRQSFFSFGYSFFSPWHTFTKKDIIGCMAGFTFIAAIFDMIPPLIAGGSLYIADEEERRNTELLYQSMVRRQITGMYLPPQLAQVMLKTHGELPLQYVMMAGEKVRGEFPADKLFVECYGSTEAGGILAHAVSGPDSPNLGKPEGDVTAWLIDEDGNLIKTPGETGELCIASPWLANGYLDLPEETASRFTPCPFEPGRTMVHTGDIMAWDENGNLQFHGRKDRMIKLRGYRVELGEIENVLSHAAGVDEAACVSVKVGGADKLCCYYTGQEKASNELKEYARDFLPDYMIPDYTLYMEALPRNERGKVDYKALGALQPPVNDGDYVPPETETERQVCDAFASALDLSQVSVTADFFDLGGTSLSVSLLIVELEKNLSFQDVVAHPTPRSLAAFLSENPQDATPEMNRAFYPLTKTQMGIYLEGLTGGSSTTYSSPYLMKADPALHAEQLIEAIHTVIAAHPSMKYVIRTGSDGMPHMFMAPEMEVDIPVVDGTEEGRLDFMREFYPVVPVTNQLLFHFAIYRTSVRCYVAIKSHLIFLDGTSISLIIAELNRALSGQPLLPETYTIQQVAMHEEQQILNGAHDKAKEYYRDLFKNMEDLPALTGDREGTLTPGVSENFRYEPGTLRAETVKAFCAANQITESTFFLGAMALTLGKYLNSKHVSFSTVYNGRALADTRDTIGTLIKRIPIYADLSRDIPVDEYLKGISRQVFTTMSNDIYSFDEVLKTCPVNEDMEFIYQGDLFTDQMGTAAGETLVEGDKWFMEQYHTGMVTGCFSIQFFSTGGLYNMTMEYRNERFSPDWVKAFADHLFTVASGLLTEASIGSISMLTGDERKALVRFNETTVDLPFIPVHQQIHAHAISHPDRMAVTAGNKVLTFRELDLLSDRLSMELQNKGIQPGTLIGVLFDREVWAYVAEIAILKSGCAFVPFIPEYPDERISFCMDDGSIPLLLTTEAQREKREGLLTTGYTLVTLETLFGVPSLDDVHADAVQASAPSFPSVTSSDLAYCIYTSGTTGRPKGVMIEHGNIFNYVSRNEKSLEIMHYAEPGRICLALASFSFDVSVVEAFVPLCNGNGVVIATENEIHSPADLARLILTTKATGITCTPTYLLNLLQVPETHEALRQLTFFDIGAEAFPARLYHNLRELREDSIILNVYGPTEATMGCSAECLTGSDIVTVGPPIANTVFFVSDTFGNELPAGVRGELIICGKQVGRGYINLPEKTRESFFTWRGMRAYHSGDLAAWTEDGKIRIFGRIDNQIKLRGFRIELDEIEKVMESYPGISVSAAAVKKGTGSEFLVGYYVSASEIDSDTLKAYLAEKLPEYMVPTALIRLEKMPRTVNEKIDRKALPDPDVRLLKAEYVPPVTNTQKAICLAMEKVLSLPANTVGLLDDFFNLGGDSLSSMIVVVEAGIDGMTGADVFQHRTPEKIAEALDKRAEGGELDLDKLEAEARLVPHVLTSVQYEYLDQQLFRPDTTILSLYRFLLRFKPEIDADRLCKAVNQMLRNHPALSMKFFFDENLELRQQYDPDLIPEVKVRDIRPETEDALGDILVRPFDKILNSSLCRVQLFRGRKGSYLYVDIHHMLIDASSLDSIFMDIINAYYDRPLEKDYYLAFLAMEEKKILSGQLEEDRKYHLERYGNPGNWCLNLLSDDPSVPYREKTLTRRLPVTEEQIHEAEKRLGVTLSVMQIAAALKALSTVTGKQDVILHWDFSNRIEPETEQSVGMYLKMLTVGCHMEDIHSMSELLASVKEQVLSGIAHNTYCYMITDVFNRGLPWLESSLEMNMGGTVIEEMRPEILTLEDVYSQAVGEYTKFILQQNEHGDGATDSILNYQGTGCSDALLTEYFDEVNRILEHLLLNGPEE